MKAVTKIQLTGILYEHGVYDDNGSSMPIGEELYLDIDNKSKNLLGLIPYELRSWTKVKITIEKVK